MVVGLFANGVPTFQRNWVCHKSTRPFRVSCVLFGIGFVIRFRCEALQLLALRDVVLESSHNHSVVGVLVRHIRPVLLSFEEYGVDGDEQFASHRDDGLLRRLACGESAELPLELAVLGADRAPGALHEHRLEVRVPLGDGCAFELAGALVVARAKAGPSGQAAAGAERGHVRPDFGDDADGRGQADAGDGLHEAQLFVVVGLCEPLHLLLGFGYASLIQVVFLQRLPQLPYVPWFQTARQGLGQMRLAPRPAVDVPGQSVGTRLPAGDGAAHLEKALRGGAAQHAPQAYPARNQYPVHRGQRPAALLDEPGVGTGVCAQLLQHGVRYET